MNLLDLYRDDIDGKIISISGGQEWRGPCPVCGGTDRFGVWPQQGSHGTFYCGRAKGFGHGCGIGGDAIQYLREARKYTYREACESLGIECKAGGGKSRRYTAPRMPSSGRRDVHVPTEARYPEDVVDPAMWREHGMKFVEACHEVLLNRPISITYLMARGISREMIAKYRLGFHGGEERDGKKYLPSFRPWKSWGLKDETKENGRPRMLVLPAGLVIPYITQGELHRITIRLVKPDPRNPKKKYHYVRGSIRDLWVSNPTAKAFVLQEAELDCIAVDGAAGDLVGTIGLGSTGTKPDALAAASLERSVSILGALDFDTPRFNDRTGRMESPGAEAGKWWRQNYGQYRRWPVPAGKDAGEAFQHGIDLRRWVLAGLPISLQPYQEGREGRHPIRQGKSQAVGKGDGQEGGGVKLIGGKTVSSSIAFSDEIHELKMLLSESKGYFRIYNQGLGVGPEISTKWSEDHPNKRRRISHLLVSDPMGEIIDNLADGLYGAMHLP